MNLSAPLSHLLIGLCSIGSLTTLAALGSVPGADALAAITGISGMLLGTGAVSMGSAATTKALMTPPPTTGVPS